jgi:hypothetical protein
MPYSLDFRDKWHQKMGETSQVTTNPSKTFRLLQSVSKFNDVQVDSLNEFNSADETEEPCPIQYDTKEEKVPMKRNEFKDPACFGNGAPRFTSEERFTVKNGLPRIVLRELRTKPTGPFDKSNPDFRTVFGQSRPRMTSTNSATFRGGVNTGRNVVPFITGKTYHLPNQRLPKSRGWPQEEALNLEDW